MKSEIATSYLLRAVAYPDSTSAADRVTYTYNRQGQPVAMGDQLGTVHTYAYDALGRQTADSLAVLGSGVDTAIQRLGRSYNVRGLTDQVTSYSDASGASVANQVQYAYNDFGQLVVEYQQHSGAVNTSSSPKVQYSYASGSNNTVRPTSVTYPSLNGVSGRVLSLNYSSTDDDALSRISSLSDGGGSLVNYTYLGLGSFVQSNAPQPNLTWTLIGSPGTTDPYTGLDRFGRVIDCRWTNASGDVERLQYGYNRDSSRQWRHEVLTTLNDELYTYDNLQRLITMQRGNLALTPLLSGEGGPSGPGEGLSPVLTSPTLQQAWTLDATGNWPGFSNSESGNTFNQTRTSNAANEITAIAQTTSPPPSNWATPAYNAVGNMTSMPSSSSLIPPTSSLSATYDAWNRLTSLGSSSTFRYDGLNRRIQKTVASVTSDAYYNSSWQLLSELTGSNQQQFIWGLRYIDDCVLRDRYSGTSFVDRLYAIQDANWNVTGLVSASGSILERYRYTPYGQPTFLNASFTPITFGGVYAWTALYCGYRWDSESGLYYVRNRYYHPLLGCWITRDPKPYGTVSIYEYTQGSPLMYTDAQGLAVDIPTDPASALIGLRPGRVICWPTYNALINTSVTGANRGTQYINKWISTIVKGESGSQSVACRYNPLRPDIAISAAGITQVWEIKPWEQFSGGFAQNGLYIGILNSCCVKAKTGNCGLGTSGFITVNAGWCSGYLVYGCLSGVIGYKAVSSIDAVTALAAALAAAGFLIAPEVLAAIAAAAAQAGARVPIPAFP